MAVYDLEEQEQISELKAWWAQYGKLITALAVAAAVASVGWQGWQWYQGKQAAEAGALYHGVEQAVGKGDSQKARELTGQLIGSYGGTAYAQMAALLSASAQFDRGDLENARAHLAWASTDGRDPALRDIARLRLASVLLQEGKLDEALKSLEAPAAAPLQARFADLRGDVLAAQGKPAEARSAYQAALDAVGNGGEGAATLREVVRVKLEALEG
ncbi:tetratricopeptide repeat protein [Thauera sp. CAU 1555]|jgi:predicted negative regulator of RcsB-dependent stress response|uniref:Ancillary SecYEG translocon subunit n=1 Tax=Thauera sedimentorum TaxID=2767595 RepID=A0ABR9B4U6_9RHOO|nr:tetratricopeptide repeat protein [Thauera sedimentorum]MBC9070486.1 tetratricopeptide repeat protein [Thauera sedimentorum]MBD8501406.1 tetratricopeptide repeat protein [Thauera sedimentorum]